MNEPNIQRDYADHMDRGVQLLPGFGLPDGVVLCEVCRREIPETEALDLLEPCCRRGACIRRALPEGWIFEDSDTPLLLMVPTDGAVKPHEFDTLEEFAAFVRSSQ